MDQEKRRFYDIEFIRLIAMIGIVGGHCFSFYQNLPEPYSGSISESYGVYKALNPLLTYYSLPIFTAIAGYLLGIRGVYDSSSFEYGKYIIRKIKRLYIPAVCFSLIYTLFFHTESFGNPENILLSFAQGAGHLWFLFMLFGLYCLSYPIMKLTRDVPKGLFLAISVLISISSCFLPLETTILTIFLYQSFFFLGVALGEHKQKVEVQRTSPAFFHKALLLAALYLMVFFVLSLVKESEPVQALSNSSETLQYFQHWSFRLVVGLISIVLTFSLLPIDIKISKGLRNLASYSYMIYIFHYFIVVALMRSFPMLVQQIWGLLGILFPFLLFFLVMIGSLLFSVIAKRIPLLRNI